MNVSLVISRRLTSRGLGVRRVVRSGKLVASLGTLRPKRAPARPIPGSSRSLKLPSGVRAVRYESPLITRAGLLVAGSPEVSCRFRCRSRVRRPPSSSAPMRGGGWDQPDERSILSAIEAKILSGREGRKGGTLISPALCRLTLDPVECRRARRRRQGSC